MNVVGAAQRRAGRPRTAVLDRRRIGEMALELVDEAGDFTLPELARRLGVQTGSLYHHVDGRAGVIELLREQISDRMDPVPLETHPWDVAMEAFFRSYRAVFAAHPRVVPLLTTATIRSPEVIAAYDKIAAKLAGSGIPAGRTMEILTAMENFVIGSALDLAAPEVMWEIPEGVEAPNLAAALAAQETSTDRAERAFEVGMATLLDAARAEAAASR
ncbi:TetR/AcrR family transcriptional regulator C-terminal domain-containing protein [Saccharopolyspora sp. NPDC050642]|uniref:TetR/AcrR family transcriptional regulator n=1 Tax=Saccharopolyspora sp. NPDC050642 TaxID=3157099 RepID=UPI0033FA81F4